MRFFTWILLAALLAGFVSGTTGQAQVAAQDPPALTFPAPSETPANTTAKRVEAQLDALDQWLGDGDNGQRWRNYLESEQLRNELAKDQPDPAVVKRALRLYRSDARGLELSRFVAVHNALADWSQELKNQHDGDLAKLAFASRGDHVPLTDTELAEARSVLREKVHVLEALLNANPSLAKNWRGYLGLDKLQPQLAEGQETTRRSLDDLNAVLRRFRENEPGLELPEFRDVSEAIERFIPTATWAATARLRDASAVYDGLLKGLEQELTRHLQRPTSETQWKVARGFGIAQTLGDSPELVSALRASLGQPNLFVRVSENMVNRTAQRPVSDQQPVRDCILGTSISGTASTVGTVNFQMQPSATQIAIQAVFTGQTASDTIGYHKPVHIYSRGTTTFTSQKQLLFSNDAFYVNGASASADTRTTINAIRKTGGNFGRRLVEKVAWKRAGEQKRQAERIAAQHAEVKVATGFDERVLEAMVNGRLKYLEKVVAPLERRDIVPEYFRMHSDLGWLGVDMTFARPNQLAAPDGPPPVRLGHDMSFQIHESAVGNYLPLAISGIKIFQETEDQQPQVSGAAPKWLKKFTTAKRVQAAVEDELENVDVDVSTDGIDIEFKEEEDPKHAFQPWSIELRDDYPASVTFDDGKLAIRMRASKLMSEDREFDNWDFIITYQMIQDGNEILLKRVGEIEVFPLGFDPAWDTKMPSAQSGFRSTLAENMNRRADRGESFPPEIRIPPVKIPDLGTMVLQQLESDNGWLTVGWRAP